MSEREEAKRARSAASAERAAGEETPEHPLARLHPNPVVAAAMYRKWKQQRAAAKDDASGAQPVAADSLPSAMASLVPATGATDGASTAPDGAAQPQPAPPTEAIHAQEKETASHPPNQQNAKSRLASSLIKLGGTGTQSDAALVVAELLKFPVEALEILSKRGTKIVVCRKSITEYRTDLAGVRPRGWPPGATWDTVPGANTPDRNEVVIAVVGFGTKEGAHVAHTGEGHGASNLVLHETAHAIDLDNRPAGQTANSASAGFNKARDADKASLSAYELQAGNAGQEESYAESAARYYGGDPKDAKAHPNLHQYWAQNPFKGKQP